MPSNTILQPGDVHNHLDQSLRKGILYQGDIYGEIERLYKRLADFGVRMVSGECREEMLRRENERLRNEIGMLRYENSVLKAMKVGARVEVKTE